MQQPSTAGPSQLPALVCSGLIIWRSSRAQLPFSGVMQHACCLTGCCFPGGRLPRAARLMINYTPCCATTRRSSCAVAAELSERSGVAHFSRRHCPKRPIQPCRLRQRLLQDGALSCRHSAARPATGPPGGSCCGVQSATAGEGCPLQAGNQPPPFSSTPSHSNSTSSSSARPPAETFHAWGVGWTKQS